MPSAEECRMSTPAFWRSRAADAGVNIDELKDLPGDAAFYQKKLLDFFAQQRQQARSKPKTTSAIGAVLAQLKDDASAGESLAFWRGVVAAEITEFRAAQETARCYQAGVVCWVHGLIELNQKLLDLCRLPDEQSKFSNPNTFCLEKSSKIMFLGSWRSRRACSCKMRRRCSARSKR